MADAAIDATPPAANPPTSSAGVMDPDAELAGIQQQKSAAIGQRDAAMGQLQADSANFDPDSAGGPMPQFSEATPQDHFKDISKQAPLLVGLAAIGGVFGKAHGMAMLKTTNAMMSGITKGSDEAYKSAREDYEQKYQEFRDKQKTWNDVYKAYSNAYKGRIDADQRALNGANAAVGLIERDENNSRLRIEQTKRLSAQIEKQHENVQKWDKDRSLKAQELPIKQQNADAHTTSANASAENAGTNKDKVDAKKNAGSDDGKNAIDLGERLLADMDGHSGMTGLAGTVRRGVESVGTAVGAMNDAPANRFNDNAKLFQTAMTTALKSKGKMGADERRIMNDAIDVSKAGVTTPIARDKIKAALDVLRKHSNDGQGSRYQTKTIGGKSYYKDTSNGQVYEGTPPGGE